LFQENDASGTISESRIATKTSWGALAARVWRHKKGIQEECSYLCENGRDVGGEVVWGGARTAERVRGGRVIGRVKRAGLSRGTRNRREHTKF